MFVRSCKQGITHLNVPQHSRPSVCNFGGTLGVWDKSPHGTPRTQPQVGIWARFLFGNGFSSNWIGSDRRLSNDAHVIARLNMASVDAGDVVP